MYSDREPFRRRPDVRQEEERFLDRGDARGQRRRAFERKNKIFKRNREQLEQTPEQNILQTLLDLNDKPLEQFQQQVGSVVQQLREHVQSHSETLQECLIDCVVELPSKTPYQAALIKLLSGKHGVWVAEFLEKAISVFNESLVESDLIRSRMLLRFFASLVAAQALAPESVCSLMNAIVDSALSIAQSGRDATGRSWQPYTDFLIYCALIALPWGSATMFEDAEAWKGLSSKIDTYMTNRPIQRDAATSPFLAPIKEDDIAARADSGGPSFVAELWSAIKELQSAGNWQCSCIPVVQLVQTDNLSADKNLVIENLSMPTLPPGCSEEMSVAECAVILNQRYPPRGSLQLLEAQHTHPDALEIDRIIVEEYILDYLFVYQGSRFECIKRITQDIPAPFPIYPLVAQTLFSQLLLLPKPPLHPVTYSAVIIRLCKATDESLRVFPRGLSGCIREIFSRMSVLDPELCERMADWLPLHLSNLGFIWPWSKWKKVIDAPNDDAQRLFVQRVLRMLVDLSYMNLIQQNLSPVEFHTLLPPEAVAKQFEELFPSEDTEKDPDQMDVDEEVHTETEQSEEISKFRRLEKLITSKETSETIRETFVEDITGTAENAKTFLKDFFRILLLCGDKNVTHTETILDRYRPFFMDVIAHIGEPCEEIIIAATMEVWSNSIHRACLVLTHMMQQEIVTATAVLDWAFEGIGINFSGENCATAELWDVVKCAMLFAETALKTAEKKKADATSQVEYAGEGVQEAAKRAASAAAELESGTTGNVQEILDDINDANMAEERSRNELTEAEARLRSMNDNGMKKAHDFFRAVFMKAFERFLGLLKEHSASATETGTSSGSSLMYYRTMARLGALCRLYSGEVAGFLTDLESTMDRNGIDATIQRMVLNSLRIGKDTNISEPMYAAECFINKADPEGQTPAKSEQTADQID